MISLCHSEFIFINCHSNHSHKKRKDSLETRATLLIFSFELEISGMAIQRIVRPKIENWKKHPGKHGKYQKKTWEPEKTGETIGETWGNVWGNGRNMQRIATRRISEPKSPVFKLLHTLLVSPANDCLIRKSVHSSSFFHGFFSRTVFCPKFILMVVGGECRSVIFVLSFHGGSTAHT